MFLLLCISKWVLQSDLISKREFKTIGLVQVLWDTTCLVRLFFCVNALLHLLHWKGLCPECVLMWLCRLPDWAKAELHWLHLNGFVHPHPHPGTGRPGKGLQLLPQNRIYLQLLLGHQGGPSFRSCDSEEAKSLNTEEECQAQGTVSEKEAGSYDAIKYQLLQICHSLIYT